MVHTAAASRQRDWCAQQHGPDSGDHNLLPTYAQVRIPRNVNIKFAA